MTVYKNILVAVDGSQNADKAFSEAIDVATRNLATLFIVAIINEKELSTSSFAYSKVLKEEREKIEVDMLKKIQATDQAGVAEVKTIVEVGDPVAYITKEIPESFPIDLVIVGASGKGSITREKIGTTTQAIIAKAPCSVMVIK
ncbi:MAG: universal stress protein [Enterococcus sp.]